MCALALPQRYNVEYRLLISNLAPLVFKRDTRQAQKFLMFIIDDDRHLHTLCGTSAELSADGLHTAKKHKKATPYGVAFFVCKAPPPTLF